MIEHLQNKVLSIFIFLILEYFFHGYFLVCFLIPSKVNDTKGSFTGNTLKLISTLTGKFGNFFLWTLFLLLSFKNFVGLCFDLFDCIGLFRRDDFKVFSLGDGLFDCIGGIKFRVNIKEFGFGWIANRLFNLRFIEFSRCMLINLSVDSSMHLLVGEIAADLFCRKRLLNFHEEDNCYIWN